MSCLLWAIDSDGEDDQEGDIATETVLVIEWFSDSQEPLHGDDHQPHYGHGNGDVFDWVGQVGNHSVERIFFAHGNVTDNDIVKEEHEDQETINKCKNSQIWLEMAEE